MQYTALPPVTLRDLIAVHAESAARTAGCHVTDIIYRDIMPVVDPARFGATAKSAVSRAQQENWQEAGFVWEDVLSRVFAQRATTVPADPVHDIVRLRPGELQSPEGILGSPDALVYGLTDYPDVAPLVGEEYKCTWKSAKGFDLFDRRYLPWLIQMQAYAHLIGTTEFRLYVLHINGGYDGFIPEVRAHRLQFSPAEIRDRWAQLVNTARHAKRL